ncbi:alpha/beta hydrolase [Cohnella caldifontis]|uniref:alpha/beta hydrolase n=1 Tax=Cohnella caldifontis TaxID=3027471 RepID=UPI0023EE1891|nr:alpha/beta hydrolase [Cohnella sp. YIM B05605]
MKTREFGWPSDGGRKVYAIEWTPDDEASVRTVIAVTHGMGEHTGRYLHVAESFTADGYAMLAFDQLGHGRTEGKRGHTNSYDDLLEGIDRMREEAARRFPGKPVILFGHSMGGNLTLNYLLRRKPDVAGAIVVGPWLKLAFDPPALQVAIARVAQRIMPAYSNHRPFNPTHLTSDPVMLERLREDKLGHGFITAKFFVSVHRAGYWALQHATELSVPLLLMHGGADSVTSVAASRQFAANAGPLCTYREWPGLRHELHNELQREDVFRVMKAWLAERLASVR